jgi:glutathione reductase (NADPH)
MSQLAGTNAKCLEGKMTRKFDLIAIGTGSAASAVASRCREAGWQVAIVDSRPFGGTCALRGCDPKKVLVGAAESVDWTRRMKGKGIQAAKHQIDWLELMRFKRSFTEPVPKRREDGFAKAGIAAFHGRARFAAQTTVRVGEETLEGRYVVIAAREIPANLEIPGAEHLTTSDQFLELDELPRRILFIGGGYTAFEFAHIAALRDRRSQSYTVARVLLPFLTRISLISSLSELANLALKFIWEPKRSGSKRARVS